MSQKQITTILIGIGLVLLLVITIIWFAVDPMSTMETGTSMM